MNSLQEFISRLTKQYFFRTGGELSLYEAKRKARSEGIDAWLSGAEFEGIDAKLESIRQVLVVMNQQESF